MVPQDTKSKLSATNLIVAFILVLGVLWLVVGPNFSDGGPSLHTICLSNVKQQALAAVMYAADHDERLPVGDWMAGISPLIKDKSAFHCPEWGHRKQYGYGFNSNLLGADQTSFDKPAEVPMIYDSVTRARSSADPLTSMPAIGRHANASGSKRNMIGYLDSHVRSVPTTTAQPD